MILTILFYMAVMYLSWGTYRTFWSTPTRYEAMIELASYLTRYGKDVLDAAQITARIETGNFTSSLMKATNNIFGMGAHDQTKLQSGEYPSTKAGEPKEFGKYYCTLLSALDYFLWLKRNYVPRDATQADVFRAMIAGRYMTDVRAYESASMGQPETPLKQYALMVLLPTLLVILVPILMAKTKLLDFLKESKFGRSLRDTSRKLIKNIPFLKK
jgi:hypothetical protein